MKKIVLLIITVVMYQNLFALVNMYHWRWRNDDGNETTATWKGAEQAFFTLSSTTEKFRLRAELENSNNDPKYDPYNLINDTLLYSTSKTGPWIPILSEAGDRAFMLAGSAGIPDLGPTTSQLTKNKDLPFSTGLTIVSSTVYFYPLPMQYRTEFEWVIKGTPNTKSKTKYYFVPKLQDTTFADHALGLPTLTTSSTLPISLTSFTVQSIGQTIKLAWSTATELNNDHYEILRSADGKSNWKAIGSLKGGGTTSQSKAYTYTDNFPLNGANYYRIKQYDLDGQSNESETRMLTIRLSKAQLNVFPNPSKGAINFTLNDFKGTNFTVLLSDMNGKVLHSEIMTTSQNNAYKLNQKMTLIPGSYVLKVHGDGLEKSAVVAVQ